MIMMEAGVAESRGKRPYMEDRHIIANKLPTFPAFSLFGIFDGHGGAKAAETLKELIVPTIETHIFKSKILSLTDTAERVQAMKVVLHNSITEVDTLFGTIYAIGEKGGSTAIVALVWTGPVPILAVANTGDCRGVMLKSEGFDVLSEDHKPNLPRERERIERAGGRVTQEPNSVCRVEGVLAVSRAVGDYALKPFVIPDPDISITLLEPRHHAFVLASDGIWDMVDNRECVAVARLSLHAPQKAAQEVMRVAQTRNAVDNMTCIVVHLNWLVLGQAQS